MNKLLKRLAIGAIAKGLERGLAHMRVYFRILQWAIKTDEKECLAECSQIAGQWVSEVFNAAGTLRRDFADALLDGDPFDTSRQMTIALTMKWKERSGV